MNALSILLKLQKRISFARTLERACRGNGHGVEVGSLQECDSSWRLGRMMVQCSMYSCCQLDLVTVIALDDSLDNEDVAYKCTALIIRPPWLMIISYSQRKTQWIFYTRCLNKRIFYNRRICSPSVEYRKFE